MYALLNWYLLLIVNKLIMDAQDMFSLSYKVNLTWKKSFLFLLARIDPRTLTLTAHSLPIVLTCHSDCHFSLAYVCQLKISHTFVLFFTTLILFFLSFYVI